MLVFATNAFCSRTKVAFHEQWQGSSMRRLEEADFEAAASLRRGGPQPSEWWVGRYKLEGDTIVEVSEHAIQWQRYRPLADTTDLFFSFARLYEADDVADSALRWVQQYGFPKEFYYEEDGLGQSKLVSSLSSILEFQHPLELAVAAGKQGDYREPGTWGRKWMPASLVTWEKTRENPPSMTIEELREEIHRAWDTLAHYEAVVNREPQRALRLPDGTPNPTYARPMEGSELDRNESREEIVFPSVMNRGRGYVESRVTQKVNEHCFIRPLDEEHREEHKSKWAWNFSDLRGAMYLQMMWVMERGATIRRCKWCPRTLPGTGPGGRKSPARKTFCGPACRMAYNRARERAKGRQK